VVDLSVYLFCIYRLNANDETQTQLENNSPE